MLLVPRHGRALIRFIRAAPVRVVKASEAGEDYERQDNTGYDKERTPNVQIQIFASRRQTIPPANKLFFMIE
jgi:hypothetical protein